MIDAGGVGRITERAGFWVFEVSLLSSQLITMIKLIEPFFSTSLLSKSA
jgi:hypothetical protein